MISNEQMKDDLIRVYSKYLENQRDEKNKKDSYRMYLEYSTGANAVFDKNVSSAVWSSFELSEGKLSIEEAKKILEDLRKTE